MADAKIWKFRGKVTKLIFPVYIVNMSFLPEKLLEIHQFLFIYTVLVKY